MYTQRISWVLKVPNNDSINITPPFFWRFFYFHFEILKNGTFTLKLKIWPPHFWFASYGPACTWSCRRTWVIHWFHRAPLYGASYSTNGPRLFSKDPTNQNLKFNLVWLILAIEMNACFYVRTLHRTLFYDWQKITFEEMRPLARSAICTDEIK